MPKKKRKKSHGGNQQESLKQLRAENEKLKLQIRFLKGELEEIQGKAGRVQKAIPGQTDIEQGARMETLFSKNNYFSYVLAKIRRTSIFHIYTKILTFIRRYKFVSITLKILTFVLIAFQSGAAFVLATSGFFISIPLTILVSQIIFLFSFFERKKKIAECSALLAGKAITVFFPSKGKAFEEDSFFRGMVKENASMENHVSIVVTPYFFDARGFTEKSNPFFSSRTDGDNILLIRRHFFFILKKRILRASGADVTEIF